MKRRVLRHTREILEIAVAGACAAVPLIFSPQLLSANPQLPGFFDPWSALHHGIRISIFVAYMLAAFAWARTQIWSAARRIRMPREFQKYRIYGEVQDTGASIEVDLPDSDAIYDVLSTDKVYQRFPRKYGRLRLLELFGKLYPVVILAEHISLRKSDVSCRLLMQADRNHPRRFELSGDVAKWKAELLRVHEKMLGRDFAWFDDLARLKRCIVRPRLLPIGRRLRLEFEICNYSDYVTSNYSVDLRRSGSRSVRDHLDNWPRRRRGLPRLARSICANQLGLNVMLVTSDGKMVFAARGAKVLTYPGLPGPPVSGTQMYWYKEDRYRVEEDGTRVLLREKGPATSYYDGYVHKHGVPNPFSGVLAQAWEETNLLPKHVRDLRLIGLNRDLTRGGLPDAFFVAHLRLTYSQLRDIAPEKARDSWERKAKAGLPGFGPHDIRRSSYKEAAADISDWLSDHPATPALVSNLYFFLQYLRRHAAEFK